ncbi:hypothetical protein RSOLAG1IB_11733 [Rhizoctonia solani AG-1 IB]|uniref:Uncharacterized protein n=1 Tax=Thanatephorus cucumeris (strain AG1-IB / isolate 7/3/14) TaxID=1108050 RepID=A0A0B7FEN7_THACB|nr:hypothetical protein RSOLAG1IB_11733 [Rhizoctonia solani AG-1 IB]
MHTLDLRCSSRESSKGVSEWGSDQPLDETSSRARVLDGDGGSNSALDDRGGIDSRVLQVALGREDAEGTRVCT